MAHLGGGDRGVLAELGAQRGVGPAQSVEGDAVREWRLAVGGEPLVGPVDRSVEDALANAVAIARLVALSTGKDEVIGLAPA